MKCQEAVFLQMFRQLDKSRSMGNTHKVFRYSEEVVVKRMLF